MATSKKRSQKRKRKPLQPAESNKRPRASDNWKGVVSRELPREDHTQMERNLFTPTQTHLNEPNRVIANADGMRLALGFHDLQQEIRVLRIAILDEWSGYRSNKDRRNHTAHGGNLIADMGAIDFMKDRNRERANSWERSFAEYYGIGYEDCVARDIQFSYRQLLEIFDVTASVKTLYKWRTRARKLDREAVLKKCTTIIEAWKTGTDGLFEEGSQLLMEYREVVRIYYQ